jgi:hypothetical protein
MLRPDIPPSFPPHFLPFSVSLLLVVDVTFDTVIRPSVVLIISQVNCAVRPLLGPSLVPEKKDSAISVPVFVYSSFVT